VTSASTNQADVRRRLDLSVVIPMYNEESRVDQTLQEVASYLKLQPHSWEIIVADDGSSDGTLDRALVWQDRAPNIRIVSIPHGGKAAAVRAGMLAAEGRIVVFTDADLATPIAYLEAFREKIEDGYDIVIGSREGAEARRVGEPHFRHVMGRVFNGLVRALVLPGIQDTQCGFKMFRGSAVNELFDAALLYRDENAMTAGARVTAFDVELLVIARRRGLEVASLPVMWTFGQNSKVDPVRDTINNLRDILTIKWHDLRGRYRPPPPAE
jgi:dolichyl-phosphate beta-glucosyltransferase